MDEEKLLIDPGKLKRRLEIARKLAAESLRELKKNGCDAKDQENSATRSHTSSNIVQGRNSKSLYSIHSSELSIGNRYSLENLMETLKSESVSNLTSLSSISRLICIMEEHVSPCCVYIWMIKGGGDLLEVSSASSNSFMLGQTLRRGEGITFLSLQYKCPILVKSISQRLWFAIRDEGWEELPSGDCHIKHFLDVPTDASSSNFLFNDKTVRPDTYLAVPLRFGDQIIGVLAFDGFNMEGITHLETLLRPARIMSTRLMNDFNNSSKLVRLYRHGVDIDKSVMKTRVLQPTNGCKFPVNTVQGRITSMENSKNGVSFVGGPRFHIQWEDGIEETEVRLTGLYAYLASSKKSLGHILELSSVALGQLIECGTVLGDLFGRARWANEKTNMLSLVSKNLPNFGSIVSRFMKVLFSSIIYAERIEVWELRDALLTPGLKTPIICQAYMDKNHMKYRTCDMIPAVNLRNDEADTLVCELRIADRSLSLPSRPEVLACSF